MNFKKQILGNHILAISIGLVYLWFGGLKYFPHLSPAENLAKNTIYMLTFGNIPSNVSIILLAIWETTVGLLLILNIYRKQAIVLALVHMVFTFTPLLFFPEQSFSDAPMGFTLIGQYIFKNIIIISALLTLYKLPIPKKINNTQKINS
jgi:uncharacterized membrane protein YphA (DoxX/SURF4 family)